MLPEVCEGCRHLFECLFEIRAGEWNLDSGGWARGLGLADVNAMEDSARQGCPLCISRLQQISPAELRVLLDLPPTGFETIIRFTKFDVSRYGMDFNYGTPQGALGPDEYQPSLHYMQLLEGKLRHTST